METITKWISYEEAQGKEDNGLGGMGGFFGYDRTDDGLVDNGARWKDYLAAFKEEAHPMLEELRTSIVKNKIRCTGEEHQSSVRAVPLWSNGKVDTYTMRAWGDLMAAVWSENENKNYGYMDFYM